MEEFRTKTNAAVSILSTMLETKEWNGIETDIAMSDLAILVEEALEELAAHPDREHYDLRALYGKLKGSDRGCTSLLKMQVMAELFSGTFRTTVENLIRSAFWELYARNPMTPKETLYDAAVVLYGMVFSVSRLVECPEDWWYRTDDQYLPFLNSIATMASEESREVRALLSGTYALFGALVFDAARHNCSAGEAGNIVEGHVNILEAHFLCKSDVKDGSSVERNTCRSLRCATALRHFQLSPLSSGMEARFSAEFLSCFENYPHIKNDPIKKMLDKHMLRIFEIVKSALHSWATLDITVGAPLIKLAANMIKANHLFAKLFSDQPENWALLLSLSTETRVAVHAQHCLSDLISPRFWCTGDPVGAAVVLNDYLTCLENLNKVLLTETSICHLRAAGAVEIFDFVLSDRRAFDPFRTQGKEAAVERALASLSAIRLSVCKILTSMVQSLSFRQLLVQGSFFSSGKILSSLRRSDGLPYPEAASLLRNLYPMIPESSDILEAIAFVGTNSADVARYVLPPMAAIDQDLPGRLLNDTLCGLADDRAKRRRDMRFAFQRTRKVALFPVKPNTGEVISTTFVGEGHEKLMMRTGMGHLLCVDVRSQKTLYWVHDWIHNEEDHIRSLRWDPSKFIITSTDLVTDTDPQKSHLWSLGQNGMKCFPVAEYKNFQFMRPTTLHAGLAVGHAPIWRRKHGCYFTMDMETKKRVMALGPLNEEENHPNFPSCHPSSEMVVCMGTIWDYRSGGMVHQFERFRTKVKCMENVFHAYGSTVLIDDQVWDLRTYGLLQRIDQLKGAGLQFGATGEVAIAKKSIQGGFDDVVFYDPTDYATISQVPINGMISDITVDRMDYHLVVSRRNGFPLLMEIGTKMKHDDTDLDLHPDFTE
ncbi:hypothetical protein BV898_14278 [Hypsibius exemplaris]|uniref:Uncharacterized protein n=1 Tax=Hypsibius exemplaris TaxID=2072580 RepID=A0A1W0W865_HYPEX|nr:hypothetical protein BV898_14278 [Hypsibius exemplaris]